MLNTELFESRYVPPLRPPADGGPERVMIVLHGLGDSLHGFSFLPQALNLPGFSYLILNAPDAYYGGYSWYDYGADPRPGIERSRDLLLDLIEELKAQGVAPSDLFFFGFSQGCLMAVDVALRAPDVLGGVCGASGYVGLPEEYPEHLSPAAKSQRILITHGTGDTMVPFEPAMRQFKALSGMGVNLEMKVYDKPHTILPEELADIRSWFWGKL